MINFNHVEAQSERERDRIRRRQKGRNTTQKEKVSRLVGNWNDEFHILFNRIKIIGVYGDQAHFYDVKIEK